MPKGDYARDGADAVHRFASELRRGGRSADRIQAKLGGEDGMATLCAVEAMLCQLWPAAIAKELVWLSRAAPSGDDGLQLQAFAADGELLCSATYRLERQDA